MEKQILDVTCGSRSIWFNKNHPAAIYCDKRRVSWDIPFGKNGSVHACHIEPDIVCDFTALPFADESFQLVVFDPPHLTEAKETAWLVKKYGVLDDDWPQMLHDGFVECMRVLRVGGCLYSSGRNTTSPPMRYGTRSDKSLYSVTTAGKNQTRFGARL